ncbi:uncharacterized protein LOC119987713 [Tripterygium wilfordii]|uniref:uncharacterized protein LOC119987713 n=1 Tax=Tripterygium wilfordii TaxID=458696 RepID=UPI0018F7EC0D|nr:uncharacterized protein LOC119987713 [Tripterygium wilfordii]
MPAIVYETMNYFFDFSLLAFFILTTILVSAQEDNKYEDVVKTVRKINKHVLLTIKSPYGDLIDKPNQPTFNHSLLRDHMMIQEVPTQMLRRKKYAKKSRINKASQICQRNIPIRRLTVADVMRVNSTPEFKKKQKYFKHQLPTSFDNHEHASVRYAATKVIYGVGATINKQQPTIHEENQCSEAHVRIQTGSEQNFESITVGWHVSPELHDGDDTTRLFLLWTNDGYETKKCYNFECDEFQRIADENEEIVLGEVLELSYPQSYIIVKIWKDQEQESWWLSVGHKIMGKWNKDVFPRLGGPSTTVEWGGEVCDDRTEMGTGRFGHMGRNKACYIHLLKIMTEDTSNELVQVPFGELTKWETKPDLYDVSIDHHDHYIYFGGPGLNTNNP